jgi:hypothetical protein
MRLLCYVESLISNEILQSTTLDMMELCKKELRQQVYTETNKLYPFGIVRDGDVKTNVNCHYKFLQDLTKITVSQYTTGHWLSYLHARRNGILSKIR